MRRAFFPALLALSALIYSPGAASAQTCSLQLLNTVPLSIEDNVAWVPGTVGTKERQFQIDTAAPDNQMGKDAMSDFGLSAIDFTPTQNAGGGAAFSIGQAQATDIDGTSHGFSFASTPGVMASNAVAVYNAKGTMFHSWANARPFILGTMRTDSLQFVVTDLPQPGSGGILSADFFQKYDFDLNFSDHKFNMFSSDHCPGEVVYWRAPGVARLPFRYKDGRIIVRVSVDAREMDAVINTGSPRSELEFDDADSFFYRGPNSAGTVLQDDGNYAYNFSILSFGNVRSTTRIWC